MINFQPAFDDVVDDDATNDVANHIYEQANQHFDYVSYLPLHAEERAKIFSPLNLSAGDFFFAAKNFQRR